TEGRRARFSLAAAGQTVEVVEPLEPGTFRSASIDFGLAGRIVVDSADVKAELVMTPRFDAVDYTEKEAFRPLIPGEPVRHHQQAARVEGTARLGGTSVVISGEGVRDRTWGYRDESAQLVEYVAVAAVFDSFYLSAMKFLGPDGKTVVDGFVTDGPEPARVTDMRVTRDAAGLFGHAVLSLADGSERTVRNVGRRGGFWVPMGIDREGPTMSAYDEFLAYDLDGGNGNGLVEQGILRRLF
ncbi:MAG: hypothetical protein ACRDY7_02245, partial [Acidimicrobiia bacterium]